MLTWIHDINTRSEHGNTDAVCGNGAPVRRSVDATRQTAHQRPARRGDCPPVSLGNPLAVAGATPGPHSPDLTADPRSAERAVGHPNAPTHHQEREATPLDTSRSLMNA
jgi:hypothetical protein